MNKRTIKWIGVIVCILIFVVGMRWTKHNRASSNKTAQEQIGQSFFVGNSQEPQRAGMVHVEPGIAQSTLKPGSGKVAGEQAGMRRYRNPDFDFELSYPEEFGKVEAQEFSLETTDVCVKSGKLLFATFSNNPHIDFGLPTPDFVPCQTSANPIFAVKKITTSGKNLQLEFGQFRDSIIVPLAVVIPTTSSGINAYVFANELDKHATGDMTAVVTSPHPRLGHPVFRTHDVSREQGIELLRKVIAP